MTSRPGMGEQVSEGEGEAQQGYCPRCGAASRPGNAFCVSCGARLGGVDDEDRPGTRTAPSTHGPAPGNGGRSNRRGVRLAAFGAGAVLLLVLAYPLLSRSAVLAALLIGSLVLAARKVRGTQSGFERRMFEAAGRYEESARRAYDEGKHREFARDAYARSKEVYGEASDRYQRWGRERAAERERNEPRREARPGTEEPSWASPGDAADVASGSSLVSAYPPRECIDRAEAFMTVKGYAVERGGSTATFARDRQINWVVFLVLLLFGVLPAILYAAMLAVAPVRTTLVTMPSAGGTELVIRSDDGEDAAVLEGWVRTNLLAGSPR